MKNNISLSATIALLAVTAHTTAAEWNLYRLGWGQNVANYSSFALRPDGWWAAAFDDRGNGMLRCDILNPNGGSYSTEAVTAGGDGAALAYDPAWNVTISHVSVGKLYFVTKSSTSWTSKVVEKRDVQHCDTSLGYDGMGRACISYFKKGRLPGLWLAVANGAHWDTQRIDANAYPVYNQIVFDLDGNPAIAYSADADADTIVDTLKVARWNGVAWEVGTVGAGGQFATAAYDPVSGNLAVAHWSATDGELRFQMWDGAAWSVSEIVNPTVTSATGCSLDFSMNGTAYVAFNGPELCLARREPSTGAWSVQVVDSTAPGSLRNSLKVGKFLPCVVYRGPSDGGAATTARLAMNRVP